MNPVCPCSGSSGGETALLWLGVAIIMLLLFRMRRARQGAEGRKVVRQEEHNSGSIFEGKTALPPSEPEPASRGVAALWKPIMVVSLIVIVGLVLVLKQRGVPQTGDLPESAKPAPAQVGDKLPRLIEIGSVTCIPCKMMAPILDELREEYAGRLQVDFVDVQKNREAAAKFGIRVIPTQVFLDAGGKELFRHEGFFPKQKILDKWKEVGIDLNSPPEDETLQPSQTESKGNL